MKRRHLLWLAGSLGAAAALRTGWSRVARAPAPEGPLSSAAQALVDKAWEGLDPARVLDVHVHVLGFGAGGTGCYVNRRGQSPLHPLDYAKHSVYQAAAGVDDAERGDAQFVERLVSLARGQSRRGRLLLLAFDEVYRPDGTVDREATEFHTPDTYVLSLARAHPDLFVPCASVHPYRPDAVEALQAAVEGGAVAVKWLPNAMRIDPLSERCVPFYRRMVELGVPLITHAGEEKAVEAEVFQRLGNPLRLRAALDAGVKVVVAHCASLGTDEDLDAAPGPDGALPRRPSFDLFLRLMDDPRYRGRLFGDLSATTQVNRVGRPLATLLARADLHGRLVNGSDYPLPAINVLVRTGQLVDQGFLASDEREPLNELDRHNPLAFDFVLKRRLVWREAGREHRFPAALFTSPPGLFRGLG